MRALRASRYCQSWRSSDLIWSKASYLSLAQSSNSCHRWIKTKGHRSGKARARKEQKGKNHKTQRTIAYLEDAPRRTIVDP
jgi:hypothetical protein